MLLDTLAGSDETLEATLDGIVPCPQVLVNVPVTDKPDLRTHPTIGPCVEDVERQLGGAGRLVLRYSGTEAVTRVMVEGRDAELVDRLAAELAAVIRKEIGA
ncbi:MAG: hypothetical protein GWN48_08725 [Actinobacteria bacterium]|nr:hypothetical protein [Actinomycetota bacterium]